MYHENLNISELIGKTMKSVSSYKNREIIFTTHNSEIFKLKHEQDCCESVEIKDICGDLNDLIDSPILQAEVITSVNKNPKNIPHIDYQGSSFTWTFYKLATIKGYVTISWYGESNGCYSEEVSFCKIIDNEN